MSKRKPLSSEEKQVKLLELLHETNDVYQLKDLERIAPQEKGIVMQSVKTTLQELVDNGLVQCEKISGSLYYWSFPSENLQKLQRQLIEVERKTEKMQQRLETNQDQVNDAQNILDDLDATDTVTGEMEVLIEEKHNLEKQIEKFQNVIDYGEVKAKESDAKKLLEAANRWTDNIFMTKTWCKRKFDKQDKELNKAFGIPEELDYIDG